MNIELSSDGERPGHPLAAGQWLVDENRVIVATAGSEVIFTLPRGCRRVAVTRLSTGRAQLALGGFKSTTVTVTGPKATVYALREAVLG